VEVVTEISTSTSTARETVLQEPQTVTRATSTSMVKEMVTQVLKTVTVQTAKTQVKVEG